MDTASANVVVGEANLNLTTISTDDMPLNVGENFLTFLDENSSVIFKGVIDPNGTFIIDPSQFVNILLDQSHIQAQGYIGTSNPMTIQTIQMPHVFTTDEESVLAETLQQPIGKQKSLTKISQIQKFVTSSTIDSRRQPEVVQIPKYPTLQVAMCPTDATRSCPVQNSSVKKNLVTDVLVESGSATITSDGKDSMNQGTSLTCNVCQEVFSGYQQLRKHKATHVDEKPFRCQHCSMEFNFEMNLKLHLIIHEAEQTGNLQCKVCLVKFSRLASLKSHLRTHEKEENLVCNECGEEVPTLSKLNDHMEEHNTRIQQCMVYRCKLCGKTFNSQALLRDHSKGHADVRKELKMFARQKARSKSKQKTAAGSSSWNTTPTKQKKKRICSVCSKAFDKPSQLERHFRVHSGAKPFKCSYQGCNKCFNQKVTLESHVLACHQRLKPFKCHMCNICFSQRGNLKSHIVKVHIPSGENEKVFKCEECACVYRRLATLNHHIARVHSVISTATPVTENPSSPRNVDLEMENSVSKSQNLKTEGVVLNPTEMGNVTDYERQENPEAIQSVSALGMANATDKSGPEQTSEGTIHEVNCVYGDSLGTPKRCLLKVKKVGQKKYHLCPACPKSFHKPSDLIRHIRVHTQERPYTCNICAKSFAVKSTLNTHMKTHDLVKSLSCNVCQKKFSVLSSLKSHERLHTGVKPFQCMQCGKQFRTSTQRRVHQKTHARQALGLTGRRKLLRIGEAKSNVTLSDPLKITAAGLVPVPNKNMKTVNGIPTQALLRPFRCTQADCFSSYKKSSHLKQHMLSHTGERPYKCLQCHRNFISSGVLKNHIKTHEGVRAYRCEKCNFAFTTNGSLKRHMATHLEERLFVCPYCARTFKTSVATRKHIKVHRNEADSLNNLPSSHNNPAKGVILINQSQPTNIPASEFSQQFPDIQVCDTSGLNAIYGSEFSEMTQELTNRLNVTTCHGSEAPHLPMDPPSQLSVLPENTDMNSASIPCQEDSLILHHSVGDNILEYSLLTSTINPQDDEDPTENLDLPLDQETNFDPSIFTLQLQQGGESLDLQFLQDSQGIGSEVGNCLNHVVSYEYETASEPIQQGLSECAVEVEPTVMEAESKFVIIHPPPSLAATSASKRKSAAEKQGGNVREITEPSLQEVTRPISEQLYTELATLPYQRRTKIEVGPDESTGNKSCPICSIKFKKKSDLDRHYLIHTGEKPYRCSVCGKSFRVNSTRQAHMRTHDEKKKTVACHVCSNLFSTKSSLRVHLRSHLNLKPYPCPFPSCSRQFRTSGHRKSHIRSHFKQAKQQKDEEKSDFIKTTGSLPSVDSIKDKNCSINQRIEELEQRVQDALETPATTINGQEDSHVSDSVQLQFDGVHFTGLDMSSLQVDDSFLQNVTNVIFLPSQETETEVVDGTNMIIEMLPGQELEQTSNSNILSGKEILAYNVNVLRSSGIELSSSEDQLNNGTITLTDNIHQYIIHNNEMMSSTARPLTGNNEGEDEEYLVPSPRIVADCDKPFPPKTLLGKQKKPVKSPSSKPFKCTVCFRSFVQKGSFETHVKTHLKDKVQFSCPLCPYSTHRKPNLKTHFSRAHPNNWGDFDEVVRNTKPKIAKSPL